MKIFASTLFALITAYPAAMVSAATIILEYVCPALGTIAANAMFFAPLSDVQKAIARGSLGDLNPLPWAFMLGNTCGWVTYSILTNVSQTFQRDCSAMQIPPRSPHPFFNVVTPESLHLFCQCPWTANISLVQPCCFKVIVSSTIRFSPVAR